MRIYLTISHPPHQQESLTLVCTYCSKSKRVEEFIKPEVRPMSVTSINALRLIEYIGSFTMEHSDCKEPSP
jgi:hypothetical protein